MLQVQSIIVRRSAAVLILRLIGAVLALAIVYSLFNVGHQYACEVNNIPFCQASALDLAGFFAVIVAYFIIAIIFLAQWSREYYEIRPGEVMHHWGILHRGKDHYPLQNIQSIELKQGILGRILNFGTLQIQSPMLKHDIVIRMVSDPEHLLQLLQNAGGPSGTVIVAGK